MSMVDIHEAKATFSTLIERVEAGEEIVLASHGEPVAKIVPYSTSRAPEESRAPDS